MRPASIGVYRARLAKNPPAPAATREIEEAWGKKCWH